MRGYVKIWTDIFSDTWFLSLPGNMRGLWLQLLVLAKDQGDSGAILQRSCSAFAELLAFDVRTFGRLIAKMHDDEKIELIKHPKGVVEVKIVNYDYWQSLRLTKGKRENWQKDDKNAAKMSSKHSIAENIRSDHTRSEQIKDRSPASPDLVDKRIADGTHSDKCDAIIKACKSYLNLGCSHAQAGQINKKAESVGQAIVAIYRIKSWIDRGITTKRYFMGAIIRDLKESRGSTDKDNKRHPGWPDDSWEMVKQENKRFEKYLDQKHGSSLGKVLKQITNRDT